MLKRVLHTAQQIVTHEETHTESVMENTVNAPAQVTVKADGWQGSTDGVNVYAGGDISATWENAEDGSIGVNTGHISFILQCGDVFLNGGFLSFDCDVDIPFKTFIACHGNRVSNWKTIYNAFYIKKGRNTIAIPSYEFVDGQTEVGIQLRKASVTDSPGTPYTFTLSNIMVKAGQEEHEYEPYTGGMPSPNPAYKQDIISTSGVLKATNDGCNGDKFRESKITIPELRAIPGTDIRDELVVYPEGGGKIVRNVLYSDLKDVVWRDSWDKYYHIDGTLLIYTSQFNDVITIHSKFICSHFVNLRENILTSEKIQCGNGQGGGFNLAFRVPTTIASNIEDWEQWIADNDIQILIARNTPIEEPLTAEQVGILRTAQYHTELSWEGLDEHLKPEVEIVAKHIGR